MKVSVLDIPSRHAMMTSTQVGFLIESQLSDRPALNVIQLHVDLESEPVIPHIMRRAWQVMAKRHDSLRLSLSPLAEGGPVQWAEPTVEINFEFLDWSSRDSATNKAALQELMAQDRHNPMQMDHAPSWRVWLVRTGHLSSTLIWTFHHAIMDGSGAGLILRELFTVYAALADGQQDLPKLPQAPSFIEHCAALEKLDHRPAQEFFRQHLAGFDTPNQLDDVFSSQGIPPGQSRHKLRRQLDPSSASALRSRAREWRVTTADVVSAVWGLVMARCSGRDEALFGVTRSGRILLPGVKANGGCRINSLPCRVRLTGKTLLQLLKEMRQYTVAIRHFEHTPLSVILDASDLPRIGSPYSSVLMFDRSSPEEVLQDICPRFGRLRFREESNMSSPLMMGAYDDPELKLFWEYDPALYSAEGISRIADYMTNLLMAIASGKASADMPLSQIDMLPKAEREALIALSRPLFPVTANQPLIDRFEQMVRQFPQHIAVRQVGKSEALTYAQLDACANHLARHLRQSGTRPGDIVGLALPRGQDYIIAVIAVLKAEAAFMSLDLSYPAGLLQEMISQSGAVMVLASEGGARHLGPQAVPVLLLDQPALQGSSPDTLPRSEYDPLRPAYLIFTSGSSGEPKGVVIPQSAIAHHCRAIIDAFGLTRDDRVLQFTSLNFDISVEEILPTLLAGATLVLRSDLMAQQMPDFLTALQREKVTVANLPTAFWHVLSAHLDDMAAPLDLAAHLRLLIVGGERPSPAAAARWRAKFPAMRWLNGYGPTETTITATMHDLSDSPLNGQDIPIGRPTGGALTYVMAADGSLAPFGVKGELWIGGPVVAQGYMGRPDLTAQAFVSDPVLGPPARTYCSGDLVSWRQDNLLAYHGRMDRQIKLRGFRIELGAIEAALEIAPQVTAAVVGLDDPRSDHAQLLAWITTRTPQTPEDLSALDAALRSQLPTYMLPRIIAVDHFPQTPGGKVDLAQLPRLKKDDDDISVATDTATKQVQDIFCQLLQLPRVGPDQSFFEIGGNSLLSVRLMSLLERDFSRRLSLAALYQNATPRQIAAKIARADDGLGSIVPIQPNGSQPVIYAVHILGPEGGFFRPLADELGPDQPLIGLTTNLLDPSSPKTLPRIAALYCDTIMRHSPTGPVHLIAISQGSFIAFELAQQLTALGREVRGLYLIDAAGPGGRPRRQKPLSLKHYISRLFYNFSDVLKGRTSRFQGEFRYRLMRFRMYLAQRFGRDISRMAHHLAAHQAAIDLAIAAYRPQVYPGRITIFRATSPDIDTPEGVASGLGWSVVAPGRVQIIDTDGGHLSILAEPAVARFAISLQREIAQASALEQKTSQTHAKRNLPL